MYKIQNQGKKNQLQIQHGRDGNLLCLCTYKYTIDVYFIIRMKII